MRSEHTTALLSAGDDEVALGNEIDAMRKVVTILKYFLFSESDIPSHHTDLRRLAVDPDSLDQPSFLSLVRQASTYGLAE